MTRCASFSRLITVAAAALVLAACGGNNEASDADAAAVAPRPATADDATKPNPAACLPRLSCTYSIGGAVSGLASGGSVSLVNASTGESLAVGANGSFAFVTKQRWRSTYNVAVATQPAGQTCSVANGGGTVARSDITTIAVSCIGTGGDTTAYRAFMVGTAAMAYYDIDLPQGGLSLLPTSPYSDNNLTQALVVHPGGKFFYRAFNTADNATTRSIAGYEFAGSNGVVALAGSPWSTGSTALIENVHALVVDPTWLYLIALVTESGFDETGSLVVFRIDSASGALTRLARVPTTASARSLVFGPDGKRAYVSNDLFAHVDVYDFNAATGGLAALATSPLTMPRMLRSLHAHPTANLLAGLGRDEATVSMFAISAETGALTPAVGSPTTVSNLQFPPRPALAVRDLVFAPSGRHLYVTVNDPELNGVLAYAVDPRTGAINLTPANPFATGGTTDPSPPDPPAPVTVTPRSLAMSPRGDVLLVCDTRNDAPTGSASTYRVDASTGALSTYSAFVATPQPTDCQIAQRRP